MKNLKPDYGIDAPGLVRFFLIAGTGALFFFFLALNLPVLGQIFKVVATGILAIVTAYLMGMGCLMLYYSKITKLRDAEHSLNLIEWSGQEIVLDIGCGRGLLLIGAAKRLTSGKAIGIDLWQEKDQANNRASATERNVILENVAERVEIKTADMRELPFPEDYFDIVTSNWAIHNLESESDRHKALKEIVRVLKPDGTIIISDIVNQTEYANYLRSCNVGKVELHNNPTRDVILRAVSFGSFAPSVVLARKSHQ